MNNLYKTINLHYLKEISGGDVHFQKELIEIFLNQIPEFISNMKNFLQQKNNYKLAKEAHTAKSSVLIFMMEQTGKDLKLIQHLAENNEINQIPQLLEKVEANFAGALIELQNCMQTEFASQEQA